jgi:hypothetical protein
MRTLLLVLSLVTVALVSIEPTAPRAQSPAAEPIRGVWYNSFNNMDYLSPNITQDLGQLKNRLCPNYIQLVAVVYQSTKTSADPHIDATRSMPDEALRRVINEVHRLGMRASLLISLFVDDGTWAGAIRPSNFTNWFNNWSQIVLHYAELGQQVGLDILVIGAELETVTEPSEPWMTLIEQVRQRFKGEVAYTTNFWFDRASFNRVANMRQWSRLDAIGITAYFELTDKASPTLAALEAAWKSDRHKQDIIADLQVLASRYGKPVHFWEIGYQSRTGTTIYPWDFRIQSSANENEQALAHQALINVFRSVPWFRGYGIYTQSVKLPINPWGYDVLGKAAEKILNSSCKGTTR